MGRGTGGWLLPLAWAAGVSARLAPLPFGVSALQFPFENYPRPPFQDALVTLSKRSLPTHPLAPEQALAQNSISPNQTF